MSAIVQKLWNYCNVLRDDGMSYGDYVEQLIYLLFLKMADERTKPPYHQPSSVPEKFSWPTLLKKDGDQLFDHYRHVLEELGKEKGLLGLIFGKSQNKFQTPARLERLIKDLIDRENWSAMSADVKGDAYEGLLEKNAQDIKSGAGQYFTPRPLIKAMVDAVAPEPDETVCDPACGTGGFLLAAHDYLLHHNPNLTKTEKKRLKGEIFKGWEIVHGAARVCAMNLLLHGIGSEQNMPIVVGDALAKDPGERFDIVLTNPPFGKKSSITVVGAEGEVSKEKETYERDDFWATTSNKQLNFLQHVKSLLKQNGRAAIVVPDNVLFEGGAGETIRRKLLHECEVHTLLRLPTGLFYAQGVKANVLFFDKKPGSETPWTKKLWIYDLRTNMHFTLKTNPLKREDLDEFVTCYNPKNRHHRKPTWSEKNPSGRWRAYGYDELVSRDKASLDIFWLKDETLEASENLPEPGVIAQEIVEDLEAALEQFRLIASDLNSEVTEESPK
ncbi:type I restriction-modification system subunit M [Candidatus Manganitrophus noduliformans]|uniref:site-specific DNA-methyltransferase (adenine-specific) n=1 Tax=Candidatus Manganitrophus noduliformans TaxID=2606439 RepID=A0A7X6DMT8_9BACT|nr:class I SAM-dependent DNA methyltransferase [Candidatus Manganitrophus noduliformans]NKE69828.1 SAM-dependent DNA methyltransferase [Candidatus Manganitrophus noduliformans]